MYCAHCGAEVREDEKFCQYCGSPVEQSQTVETAGVQQFDQLPPPSNFKGFVKRTDLCSPDVRKNIQGSWIMLFVCAGISIVYAIVLGFVPIDGILLALIALWMMLTYSLASSITANVVALIEFFVGIQQTGEFRGYLVVIAAIFSLVYILKGRKQYKNYLAHGTAASPLSEVAQRRSMLDDPKD